MHVREKPAAAGTRRGDLLPLGPASNGQDHASQAALPRRSLAGFAEGRRVLPLHGQPGTAARGDRSSGIAAGAGCDRRSAEGARPPRRGALADREPRRAVRAVWFERPQGAARRRQPSRRARHALRTARPDGRRARHRVRSNEAAQPRLSAAHVRGGPATTTLGRLHRQLPEGRGGRRRAGSQPASLRRLSERRGLDRRRDREFLEHRRRLRSFQPHCQRLLRDLGGHSARALAARLSTASETPPRRGPEVLLCGRGHRQPSRPQRRARVRLGTLRQGVRELGLPRTRRLPRLQRTRRRPRLLAPRRRHGSGFRARRHALGRGSEGEPEDRRPPVEGIAQLGEGQPARRRPRGGVLGAPHKRVLLRQAGTHTPTARRWRRPPSICWSTARQPTQASSCRQPNSRRL